ncbi:MAG TPA: methylated-DNA--[protein]-cysteine S-methyltransferase, partial [Candidatus Acidoferrum sp.]|nr:methylated-DNA--[protein]-cysteine S-methyltransferase [Candidatus Acidoferrum sp.]
NETELIGLYFDGRTHVPAARSTWAFDPQHPVLRQAQKQLMEFFAGKRIRFSLPLKFNGTRFQERVWREIARIPYGEAISYSELARRAGNLRAIRAAGTNTGLNPLGIVIPCHRVIGKDGSITGYAGGLEWKRHLLNLENKLVSIRARCPSEPLVARHDDARKFPKL